MKKESESIAENLRFLLWREGVKRENWVEQLADWVGSSSVRAEKLIRVGDLQFGELERLTQRLGVDESDLQYTILFKELGTDILKENLIFLLDALEHGSQKKLAATLRAKESTVSRWKRGKTRPQKEHIDGLCSYFHIDLESEPLFLSLDPLTEIQKKSWLHQRIDELDSDQLHDFFPALQRLLGGK